MEQEKSIPAGWTLTCDEVSNNVYEMRLSHQHGPFVENKGVDLAEMLAWCLASARDIDDQLRHKKAPNS